MEDLQEQLHRSRRYLDLMTHLAALSTEPGDKAHVIRRSLEVICRTNNWAIGQYWLTNSRDETASCTDFYWSSSVLTNFRNDSTDRRLSKGVCLPGRIWSNGLPIASTDLENETGLAFTRKSSAAASGIKSGCGFPIKNGPFIIGVFEFFSFDRIVLIDADVKFYDKLGIYLSTLIAQKEAYEALRQQEFVNKTVMNHAYNAFIAIDEASLITDWSERAVELFGWTKDEVIGKPLAEIIIPERYRDAHMKGLFRYMTTKHGPVLNKPVQAPALRKNGNEILIELLIFPIEGFGLKRFGAFIVDKSKPLVEPQIVLD